MRCWRFQVFSPHQCHHPHRRLGISKHFTADFFILFLVSPVKMFQLSRSTIIVIILLRSSAHLSWSFPPGKKTLETEDDGRSDDYTTDGRSSKAAIGILIPDTDMTLKHLGVAGGNSQMVTVSTFRSTGDFMKRNRSRHAYYMDFASAHRVGNRIGYKDPHGRPEHIGAIMEYLYTPTV